MTTDTLLGGFLAAAERHPQRPALEVAGERLSYGELRDRAAALGTAISAADAGGPPLTAILASRSAAAFVGVLGALWAGHGYVPVNPSFPARRGREMLLRAGCRTLVADAAGEAKLDELLEGIEAPPRVFSPGSEAPAETARAPAAVSAGEIAYLLFTSGSTGRPKGVGVAHRNVLAFLEAIRRRYDFDEGDRFSQTFDMTFDLSVFDMFVSWSCGACLCCPSERQLMAPARFIRDSELSVWFSVPSLGAMMRRLRMLKEDSFPTLRHSLFCGEPLPGELAGAWSRAAPGSTVENLYGPTEATIACTAHSYRPDEPGLNGVVPIGSPLAGSEALVVDEELREVEPGGDGELLVAGPQVTPGYWRDPEKTAAAFVVPPGREEVHYRTGDRVRRPRGEEPLAYLGRLDHQIKVMGHRVELGEVEAALRELSGVDAAVAVGWPRTESGADGLVAFLGEPETDVEALRGALAERLPDYMVPRRFELLPALPLNSNGKFDRRAMLDLLESAPA